MTPLKKRLSLLRSDYRAGLRSDSYLKINIILAGVIVLVMAYSGIFSPDRNNYPVVCIHEKITGMKCFSCGLSHSFSLIVRGRITEAYRWNSYGMQVFLFFLLQLVMRIVFSLFYVTHAENRKQLILYDITGSIIIFLVAFYPFFRQLVLELIYSLK
jgi:Protein of unknown function (DUF2752)